MSSSVFLDCGSHLLEGLNDFRDRGVIDDSWELHTFEPNPACEVSRRLESFDLPVTLHAAAVWTHDGTTLFRQEDHSVSRSRSPSDGVSSIDGWASAVVDSGYFNRGHQPPIEVRCLDLSRFVEDLPHDALIVCKMDIEGSEYPVLRRMVDQGTIERLEELYVEFHAHSVAAESEESTNELKAQIRRAGVVLHEWF